MAVKPNSKGIVTGTKSNDKITFGTSPEWQKALTVNAGAGNDTIDFKKSKYKNNKLNGEAGNDTIYGGTNIDIIKGGLGTDLIYGYNGKDELYGDAGKDTIYGGAGDDYLNGGADNDKLYGDAGTDTLMGGDGNDSLYGGAGIDSIVGGNGNDYIEGGAGFGRLFGLTGNDTIKGGKDKDTIDGGDDKDVLYGGGDSDTIKGNKGNDVLYGEDGNDYLYGMNDNDTLYGGIGNDLLDGGPGNDSLIGGDGNDTVRAGAGDDYVDSGNGDDFIQGHGGKDTLKGGNGNDTIEGNDGDDLIYGDSGNDLLRGGNGDDAIYGGKGVDTINAGAGINYIYHNAGDGNDIILSGGGTDYLYFIGENNVTGQISQVNDIVITRSNGEKITLKDFMKSGHSVQSLNIGGAWQDVADFFGNNLIYSTQDNETINGTPLKDVIVVSHENCKVYGKDGNDTIQPERSNFYIEGGRGNDEININAVEGNGTVVVNRNDGSDTILGIGNIDKNSGLTLKSDVIFNQYRDFYYILGLKTNNDLRIDLNNNKTITVKDYFSLPEAERYKYLKYYNPIKNKEMYVTDSMILRENPYAEIVTPIPAGTLEFTITNNNSIYEYSNNYEDSDRTTNINADNCCLFLNLINTNQEEKVTITGKNNYISSSAYKNQITTSGYYNEITIDSPSQYSNNYVNSYGDDTITLSEGKNHIDFRNSSEKTKVINIASDLTEVVISNTGFSIMNTKHTDLNFVYKDNMKVVFEHYLNPLATDPDMPLSERVYFAEMKQDGSLSYKTEVMGSWKNDGYNNMTFNMDTEEGMQKYSIKAGAKAETTNISNLTQYVDMKGEIYTKYQTDRYHWAEVFSKELGLYQNYTYTDYDYSFQFLDPSNGLFENRKDTYFKGSDSKDLWFDYELDTGKYTIDDRGGSDTFVFNESVSNIRVFFDIKADQTIGKDLYFMSSADLGRVIYNWDALDDHSLKTITDLEEEANNFLCIKDAFNSNGGKIENVYVEDSQTYKLNYTNLTLKNADMLVSDVVGWLSRNGCDSVSEAIKQEKSDYELYSLYNELNIYNLNQQIWQIA